MTYDANWERDLELLPEMVAMQNSGQTLHQVALAHGLRRRRVRVLLEASNYHCHPIPGRKRPTPEQLERRKQRQQENLLYRARKKRAKLQRRANNRNHP